MRSHCVRGLSSTSMAGASMELGGRARQSRAGCPSPPLPQTSERPPPPPPRDEAMGVEKAASARLSGAGRRLGTWARPPSPANRPLGAGGDTTPGPASLPLWRLPSWEGAQRLGIALCVLIATPRRGLPTTALLGEERGAPEAQGQSQVSTGAPCKRRAARLWLLNPPALKIRVTVSRSRYSGARGPGGSWGGPFTSLGLGFLRCKVGLATLPPTSSGGKALQATLPSPCTRYPGPRGPDAAQKTPRARQADPPHNLQPSPKPDSLRSGFGNKVKGSSAGPS